MGWKMAQQLIWTLLILCVIFSTFVVPGSTGYISPSQEPFSLITTLEESAVGDGPTTAPQSNGFPQPPLKSPAIVQTIKGSAPVLAPSESATVPPHDSAPQLPLISPHASAPPPPVLAVLPHASTPPPPFLEVPPTSASPPLILKVPPHAFIPSPPIQAVPPHAPALPPPIPPDAPLASPPILPMLEVPPHASALPPPIVEVPPHAFAPSPPIPLEAPPVSAPFPPILEVPPHASAPSPPILKMPPHASALPQSIPAIPPHTSTPPSQIPLEPPFASAPPLPMIETPPLVVASPPPAPLHISTPPPPILTKSPLAYTPSSPTLEVPPHASTPPSPILEVPPHVSTPPSPILVVPPNAPSPPSPNLIVQPPSAPLPPIQAMPPPTAPPPPILKVSPPASTPPPSILPEAPLSSEPSPPVLEVPPHDSTSPPPILPEAPFAFAPPPPILEVPPHASTPLSHALPKHAPPPLFGIAVPPNVSAPPHNSIPSPSSVQPNMSAQPPQGTPIPASPPIPVRVLPPVSDSIPSHDALPESPSIPPVSLPLLSPGSVPPHTLHPPSSPMAPQAFAQSPSGLPTRPLSPVSSAVPPLPNALAPSHHALPQAHAMPPRLSPPPPGSPGLPTRALSPASSVVSPPPNSLAPSHHSLPQAPSMPPRVLSLPPPGSPPPVSAPSVHSMPPSLPLSPLVRPFPPTQPPSRLPKKASSPPPFMVSKPPNISSTSNKSRPLQPTMSPLGSSQPPPGLSVQVSAPTPSVLPLTQNVSAPPHNFSPASPTVPPHASAQPPSAPAIMPTPINISPPPMNVVRQHAQTPKPVAVSLSPQASSAPGSPKSSVASTPPASVVDQQNAPSVSPLTSRNQSQYGRHKASPAVASAPGFSPRSAPSALNSTIHTNSAPGIPAAALPSPETSPSKSYSSPVTSPSNSNVKHHYARKKRSSPAPETSGGFENPPLYAPQPVNQHTQPSPRHAGSSEVNIPSPSPSAMENIILAPPPSMIASSGHSEIPIVSPKISPSRASINNPKRPLAAPIIALPPPPPNEDCAYLTCTEPLTNTPPGSPCGCVYPMQVRLRLSVDLYTFFPLVLELAREIAAGVFMKQSQVRIMGANAAIQQPEKTDVLIDLVPLGEKFDYVTAFLTFQRFWHKQISIDKSRFGSYEVLYVHYPGLPPSPPVASSDMAVINGDPSSGQGGSDIHPLAVDVPGQRHKHGLSGGLIAVIVFSAVAALVLCLSIAWVVLVKRRKNLPEQPISHAQISSLTRHSAVHSGGSGPSSAPLSLESSIAAYTGSAKTFSLSEIEKATDNFNPSKVLGEGGFGLVYSGILEDGTKIAVKVLKRDDQQGGREFLAEVEMLSRLHHRNLVKLIGICVEERTRCLVYELVPNGSVDSHLHGMDKETSSLEWDIRMKIALGAARGLAYLHEDSSPRVIHRDFKASNILLENDFTPKVSDFGLARTGMEEESKHISTRVMGTFGYVAPEYAMTGHLLVKSDVYSYGVVLLELLTGRKPVDMSQPPGQENLVAWTRPLLTSKEGLESIIDPSLGPNISYNSIAKVAAIASMCVQPEVSHRPFMGEVVQALKLVCHECEDAKDDEESTRTSCSHENLSPDFDPRMSPVSGEMLNPSQSELMIHSYVSGHDPEKGVSVSNIFSASERVGRQVCGSSRRHSASGPVRVGRRDRWFWHKTRSRGSISENGVMHKFWSGSH